LFVFVVVAVVVVTAIFDVAVVSCCDGLSAWLE
jgi:hypothetical protein